jgi:hypothetical protein
MSEQKYYLWLSGNDWNNLDAEHWNTLKAAPIGKYLVQIKDMSTPGADKQQTWRTTDRTKQ